MGHAMNTASVPGGTPAPGRPPRAAAASHPAASVLLRDLLSEEGRRNPYPVYARLHELGPALRLAPDARHAAVIHGYDAVGQALRDPAFRVLDTQYLDLTSTRWREHPVVRTMQNSLFHASGEHLVRLRRLFGQAFSAAQAAALEPMISRIADGLLDRLAALGAGGQPVDFMAEFALRLPTDVIGELVGVPERDRSWFPDRVRAFDAVLEVGQRSFRQLMAADAAAEELTAYFAELIASRRAHPRPDLASTLAALGPDQLAEQQLMANLIVVFNAGFRTTTNLLGNGLRLLLDRQDAMAALRADPTLAPSFVEEILRYDPPVHFAQRFAAEDTEIAGVAVEKQRSVLILTGAANRDPRRFPDPDTFDPARADNQHFAFSAGPHYCLGAALGRIEGRLAFLRLLGRFPGLALAAAPPPHAARLRPPHGAPHPGRRQCDRSPVARRRRSGRHAIVRPWLSRCAWRISNPVPEPDCLRTCGTTSRAAAATRPRSLRTAPHSTRSRCCRGCSPVAVSQIPAAGCWGPRPACRWPSPRWPTSVWSTQTVSWRWPRRPATPAFPTLRAR